MPEALAALLGRYGYALVFAGVFLEGAGVPVPGETVVLAAAFLAQRGMLSLLWVVAVAVAAAILGDNLGYWIGRRGGRLLAERRGWLVGLTPARLAALDAFTRRHGARMVFLARFVSGLRVFAPLFAGMSGLPWRRFVVYNAAGALAWATVVSLAGYFFGRSWTLLETWIGRAGLFIVALVTALVLVGLARRHGPWLVATADRWLAAARLPVALTLRELVFAGANLAAIALFAKIAEDVVTRESTGFDHAVSLALHRVAAPWLDVIMRAVTTLASRPLLLVLGLAVVGWCLRRGDRRAALAFAAVAAADGALSAVLKLGFQRARPSLWTGVEMLPSYSFPSGHAMAAVAIYGMAAVVIARLEPRLRRLAALLTPLLALLVGVSRVYLGVHWPTDVLAGFAAGACLLFAGVYVLERGRAALDGKRPASPCARPGEESK